ncbi:MAG: hypothetical protein JRH20_14100 [Deltaproteobacteria bacterium]|nr:hypothetical protein [Deltaproteobacteria bacterium]
MNTLPIILSIFVLANCNTSNTSDPEFAKARTLLKKVIKRAGGVEALQAVRTIRKGGYVAHPNLQWVVTSLVEFPNHGRRAILDGNPANPAPKMSYALVSSPHKRLMVNCLAARCKKRYSRDKGEIQALREELVLLEAPYLLGSLADGNAILRAATGMKLPPGQLAIKAKLQTGTWATIVMDAKRRVIVEVRRKMHSTWKWTRTQVLQFDDWRMVGRVLYPFRVHVDPAVAVPPDASEPIGTTFFYQNVELNGAMKTSEVVGDLPVKTLAKPFPPMHYRIWKPRHPSASAPSAPTKKHLTTLAKAQTLLKEVIERAGGVEALRALRTIRKVGYVNRPNLDIATTTLVEFPGHGRRAVLDTGNANGKLSYALVSSRRKRLVVGCITNDGSCEKRYSEDMGEIQALREELVLLEAPYLLASLADTKVTLRSSGSIKLAADHVAIDVKLQTGTWATIVMDTKRRVLVEIQRKTHSQKAGTRKQVIEFGDWRMVGRVLYPFRVRVDPTDVVTFDGHEVTKTAFFYKKVQLNKFVSTSSVVGDMPFKKAAEPYPPKLIPVLHLEPK